MKWIRKRLVPIVVGLLLAAGIVWAFLPGPVPVDMAVVSRGLLQVAVEEDGKTRIRERYVVSAPVAGQLLRIDYRPGRPIEAGKTVLATLDPSDPALLDARARAEAKAKVHAAESSKKLALAKLDAAREAHSLAKIELERARPLLASRSISKQEYDAMEHKERITFQDFRAAQFALDVADFELSLARAAFIRTLPISPGEVPPGRFEIASPISGKILRVFQESATVVTPGMKLLEVGDPTDLEIEIDVLSRDAVNIAAGQKVILQHWGGESPLEARVRLVEPAGFLKVSALGVEEQRVWIIADFVDPWEKRPSLGDAFRVQARIITWEEPDVLKVPAGALFRQQDQWSIYVVENGRAVVRAVVTGRGNGLETQILDGLALGESVIVHPSDKVKHGVKVSKR